MLDSVMADNHNPQIAAILETLRQLGPPQKKGQQAHLYQVSIIPSTILTGNQENPLVQQRRPVPCVDPKTIVTWPPALRHILKSVATDEQKLISIRKLIDTQNTHESEWHAGRQALMQRHSLRPSGRAKLESILFSINPALQPSRSTQFEDIENQAEARELAEFDKKVYKAQIEMVAAMSKELELMGVPFFGVRTDLVMQDEIDAQLDGSSGKDYEKTAELGKIDEKQLLLLQKRMVETLQDLSVD